MFKNWAGLRYQGLNSILGTVIAFLFSAALVQRKANFVSRNIGLK